MNEKLAMWAGRNIRSQVIRAGHGSTPNPALVSVTKATEGGKRCVLRFSLHERAVKSLGWMQGDRIKIEVVEGGAFVLSRTDEPMHTTLCASAYGGHGGKKSTRRYVRLVVNPEFFDCIEEGNGNEVEIKDGAIAFSL